MCSALKIDLPFKTEFCDNDRINFIMSNILIEDELKAIHILEIWCSLKQH